MPDAAAHMAASMFALDGRVAAVSGASRGIGAAIAAGLRGAGARVFGISRSGTAPAGVAALSCDIADPAAVGQCFATIAASGGLSILVHAAGRSLGGLEEALALKRFRDTLEINLTAAYALALIARPLLAASGCGSIINITSINAMRGFPGNPGYVAAKAGLAGLTRALAVDFAADAIRVNAIAPGYVRTAMTEASFTDPALHEARRRHTLLKRWGAPEDMVGAALFLASDASRYLTGQQIIVDGGWTINGLVE